MLKNYQYYMNYRNFKPQTGERCSSTYDTILHEGKDCGEKEGTLLQQNSKSCSRNENFSRQRGGNLSQLNDSNGQHGGNLAQLNDSNGQHGGNLPQLNDNHGQRGGNLAQLNGSNGQRGGNYEQKYCFNMQKSNYPSTNNRNTIIKSCANNAEILPRCDKGSISGTSSTPPSTPIVVPIEVPPSEPFDTENFHGSIQQVLYENVGRCVNCEFLVGTTITTIKSGIIYYVGRSYLILYSPTTAEYILCDIFSVKFVTFVKLSSCLD